MSTSAAPMILRLLHAPSRRPVITLVIAGLLTLLAAIGAAQLRPLGSIEAMLDADDPAAQAFGQVARNFRAVDNLLLLVGMPGDAGDVDPAVCEERFRRFAKRLEEVIAQSAEFAALCDGVSSVDLPQMREFIEGVLAPAGLYYLDAAGFDAVRARLTQEGMREQIARNEEMIAMPGFAGTALSKTLLRDPLRLHEILLAQLADERLPARGMEGDDLQISRDGRSLLVRLNGKRPASDLDFTRSFMAAARAAVDRANEDRLDIAYSGAYAIAAQSERCIRGDMIGSVTESIVLLHIFFLIVYRRFLTFYLAILPVVIAVVAAFGTYSLFSMSLTPLSAVTGAVVAGLGVDYAIHYLTHFTMQRAQGAAGVEAVRRTTSDVAPALGMVCATSMAGFLNIGPSGVQALRDFALLSALALGFAVVATLTVIPAALTLCHDRWILVATRPPRWSCAPILRWVAGHARGTLTASLTLLVVAVGLLALTPGGALRFETDLTVMHPRPNPPLETQKNIARRFASAADMMIVHLSADSPDGLLTLAHQVRSRLRGKPAEDAGVLWTFGPATLLPDPRTTDARAAEIRKLNVERILADFHELIVDSPFDPAAYEGYAAFLRRFLNADPAPNLATLRDYPRLGEMALPRSAIKSESAGPHEAMTLVFLGAPLEERQRLHATITTLRDALRDLPGATLTGLSVLGHDTEHAIRRDLSKLLIGAGLTVAILVFLYFRSLRDTLLVLVPPASGLIGLLAIMALSGQHLNMVNMLAMPILVGTSMDSGIFLLSLVRLHAAEGRSDEVRFAALTAGGDSMILFAVTTVLTFVTLLFTSTPAIQSLGVVMNLGVVTCLAGTFFVLLPCVITGRRQSA